jgi:hypothetical protein
VNQIIAMNFLARPRLNLTLTCFAAIAGIVTAQDQLTTPPAAPHTVFAEYQPATTTAPVSADRLRGIYVSRYAKLHGIADSLWGGHGLAVNADDQVDASHVFWTHHGIEIINKIVDTRIRFDVPQQQVNFKTDDQPPTTQSIAFLDGERFLIVYTPDDIPTGISMYRRYESPEELVKGPPPPPIVEADLAVCKAIIEGCQMLDVYSPDQAFMAHVQSSPAPGEIEQLGVLRGVDSLYTLRKIKDPAAPGFVDQWRDLSWVIVGETRIDPPTSDNVSWRARIELVPAARRSLDADGNWSQWQTLTPREATLDTDVLVFNARIQNNEVSIEPHLGRVVERLVTKDEIDVLPK